MEDAGSSTSAEGNRLRERPSAKPLQLHNSDDAKHKVLELNEQESKASKQNGQKRTYGRTPDGTGMCKGLPYTDGGEASVSKT